MLLVIGMDDSAGKATVMKRNGYIERQAVKSQVLVEATQGIIQQLMADTLCLVLNDQSVMGKQAFGKDRVNRILEAWTEKYDEYFPAVQSGPEQDYKQQRLDEALRLIFGEDFQPFDKRYEMVSKPSYKPRR